MKHLILAFWLFIYLFLSISCGGGNGVVEPPINGNDGRVDYYTLLYEYKICRWHEDAFPLKIYINDPPEDIGTYGTQLKAAVIDGIGIWDEVIAEIPDAFNHEDDFDSADIFVHWETMNLDGYTVATEYSGHIAINKIALSDDMRDLEATRLLMGHELGHVLGLNLSGVPGDLMFSHINPLTTILTQRDRDMINWLYSQESYVPIVSQ